MGNPDAANAQMAFIGLSNQINAALAQNNGILNAMHANIKSTMFNVHSIKTELEKQSSFLESILNALDSSAVSKVQKTLKTPSANDISANEPINNQPIAAPIIQPTPAVPQDISSTTNQERMISELATHTQILNSIASNIGGKTQESNEKGTTSPGQNILKNIFSEKTKDQIVQAGLMIAVISASLLMLGMAMKAIVDVDFKKVAMFTGVLVILFKTIADVGKTNIDMKKAGAMLILMGGTLLTFAIGMRMIEGIEMTNLIMVSSIIAIMIGSVSAIGNSGLSIKDVFIFDMFSGIFVTSIVNTINSLNRAGMLPPEKLELMLNLVLMLVGSLMLISKYGKIGFVDALGFNFAANMLATSIVEISGILQNVKLLSDEQASSIGRVSLAILPVVGTMALLSDKMSMFGGINMSIYAMALPHLASGIVKVAHIMNTMPNNMNLKSVAMATLLAVGLIPFIKSTLRVFQAITPALASDAFSTLSKKLEYSRGTGLSLIGTDQTSYTESNMNILKRLGMAMMVLPILTIVMITTAGLFSMYTKMGGTFEAPPIKWSASVGIAMFLFAQAFRVILDSMEGPTNYEKMVSVSGSGGTKNIMEKNSSGGNLPGAFAMMGTIALTMVGVAAILSFFPKNTAEKSTPSTKWVMNVGIGMMLFAMSLKRIVKLMRNETLSGSATGKGGKSLFGFSANVPQLSAVLYMLSMAISMVGVAKILQYFPSNPVAPPLAWSLSVGLSIYMFAKAYSTVSTAQSSSGGIMGMFGKSEKTFSAKAMLGGIAFMNMVAMSMVSIAFILKAFPSSPVAPPLGWSISVGIAMYVFSIAASKIISNSVKIKGDNNVVNMKGSGAMGKALGAFSYLTMLSLAIVATAHIFSVLPSTYNSPDLAWTIKTGAALLAFAFTIKLLGDSIRKSSSKDLLKSYAMLSIIALVIVQTSTIFKALPATQISPDLSWTIKASLAMLAFSGIFLLLGGIFDKTSPSDMVILVAELGIVATSIVALAWIFQALPVDLKAPGFMWVLKAGGSMAIMAASIAAVQILGITTTDLLSSTTTILLIGASIVALAWIFQALPADLRQPSFAFIGFASLSIAAMGGALALVGALSEPIAKSKGVMDNILIASVAVAAIMYVAGQSDADFKSILIFAGFMAITVGIGIALATLSKFKDKIKDGAEAMLFVAMPIAAISAAAMIWSKAFPKADANTIASLGLLTLTVGVLGAIGFILGMKGVSDNMLDGAVALLAMAVPIVAISAAMLVWTKAFPKADANSYSQIGLLALTVGVLGAMAYFAGKQGANIVLGALQLAVVGVAIIVIAYGMEKWKKVFPTADGEAYSQIGLLTATIGIVGGLAFLAGSLGPVVAIGAVILMVVGASIAVFAYSMEKWKNIFPKADKEAYKQLGLLTATISGIGVTVAAIGLAGGFVLAGAVVLGVVGGSLLILGNSLKGIGAVMDSSKFLFEKSKANSDKSNLSHMISSIVSAFTLGPGELVDALFSIPAVLAASASLKAIGWALKDFSDINIDVFDLAENKIPSVLTGVMGAFAKIGKENAGDYSIAQRIFVKGYVADGIASVKGAGDALKDIMVGVVGFANMKFTDADGNVIQLTGSDLENTTNNIVLVLDSVTDAFKRVGERNKKNYGFDGTALGTGKALFTAMFTKGAVAEGIQSVSGMGQVLTSIAKGVVSFANMKFTDIDGKLISLTGSDLENTTNNIVLVLDSVTDAFKKVGERNKKNYGFDGTALGTGKALFTAMFTKGAVAEGIQSVSGMGQVLSEIVSGVVAFANMKFTGIDGELISLTGANLENTTNNIVLVLDSVTDAFKKVGERNKKNYGFDGTALGTGKALFTALFTKGAVAEGIQSVSGMGQVLSSIASGLVGFSSMKFTQADGTIVDLGSVDNLTMVTNNIEAVLDTLTNAFVKIGIKNKKKYGFDGTVLGAGKAMFTAMFTKGAVAEGIQSVSGMGQVLTSIAEGIQGFANLKFTNYETGETFNLALQDLTEGGSVFNNIETILTTVGSVFGKIGSNNNTGGIFSSNNVEDGINAVKGMGTELFQISEGVMNFANLTFTDYTDPEKPILKNLPMSWLDEKTGEIPLAIESVLTVVAKVFAKIGKGELFDAEDVEDGIAAVQGAGTEVASLVKSMTSVAEFVEKGIAKKDLEAMTTTVLTSIPKALVNVTKYLNDSGVAMDINATAFLMTLPALLSTTVKSLTKVNKLDDKTLALYETNVPRLMNLMPNALIGSLAIMSENTDNPFESFKLLTDTTTTIADAVDKIAKAEEPLEKVAKSFESISESMSNMTQSIDSLDSMKLEKMNTLFNEIKYIAYPENSLPVQDIPGQIADGIDKGISKSLDKADFVADKLKAIQTQQVDAQVQLASGDNGNAELVNLMNMRLERLEMVMTKIHKTLKTGIPVDVENTDDFTINK